MVPLLLLLPAHADEAAIHARLDQTRAALSHLHDATYVLDRREWRGGAAITPQRMAVKYRRPSDLYLLWVGDAHEGRQGLYREGWNDGKLRVDPGPMLPTVNLDPGGAVAMSDSRHPVWMASIARVAQQIVEQDAWLARPDTPSAVYQDQGVISVDGRPAHCYQADLPRDQAAWLWADRVLVCIEVSSGLPARSRSWEKRDGAWVEVEDYRFTDIRVNPGLGDADFDPETYGM